MGDGKAPTCSIQLQFQCSTIVCFLLDGLLKEKLWKLKCSNYSRQLKLTSTIRYIMGTAMMLIPDTFNFKRGKKKVRLCHIFIHNSTAQRSLIYVVFHNFSDRMTFDFSWNSIVDSIRFHQQQCWPMIIQRLNFFRFHFAFRTSRWQWHTKRKRKFKPPINTNAPTSDSKQ